MGIEYVGDQVERYIRQAEECLGRGDTVRAAIYAQMGVSIAIRNAHHFGHDTSESHRLRLELCMGGY